MKIVKSKEYEECTNTFNDIRRCDASGSNGRLIYVALEEI